MGAVQLELPFVGGPRAARRWPARRRSYARVWSDPAVVRAEGEAGERFDEWRAGFVRLIRALPSERRAELRARLAGGALAGTRRLRPAA
ncbi:MAG TPA: hypothetical protein VFC93_14765 [Chloroflexota bacterium]|nr:hypothetical protein [Chloroflexota bacterium]